MSAVTTIVQCELPPSTNSNRWSDDSETSYESRYTPSEGPLQAFCLSRRPRRNQFRDQNDSDFLVPTAAERARSLRILLDAVQADLTWLAEHCTLVVLKRVRSDTRMTCQASSLQHCLVSRVASRSFWQMTRIALFPPRTALNKVSQSRTTTHCGGLTCRQLRPVYESVGCASISISWNVSSTVR